MPESFVLLVKPPQIYGPQQIVILLHLWVRGACRFDFPIYDNISNFLLYLHIPPYFLQGGKWKDLCFIESLCPRPCPAAWYPTFPRGVTPPLRSCGPTSLFSVTRTIHAPQGRGRRHLPRPPLETSLRQTQQIEAKSPTVQSTPSSTTNSTGHLPDGRKPKLTTQNIPPSVFLEHFWFVVDKVWSNLGQKESWNKTEVKFRLVVKDKHQCNGLSSGCICSHLHASYLS